MTRYLLAVAMLAAPLLLSGCIGYSERVVVRDRGPGYYDAPYRGYWGPPPGPRYWNRY